MTILVCQNLYMKPLSHNEILFDVLQSEEGGRFYKEENKFNY